jgi:hypothetical protein
MLNFLLQSSPSSRLAVISVLLAGVTIYFRKQLVDLPRPSFDGAEFVEDSKNGVPRARINYISLEGLSFEFISGLSVVMPFASHV